jgi:hypothetical protein
MAKAKAVEKPAVVPGTPVQQRKHAAHSVQLYRLDSQQRITAIREGIPASTISSLAARMDMSKERLLSSLGLTSFQFEHWKLVILK